jgi:hypothetical protein
MPEDKENNPILKKLIGLILEMQSLEEKFIDLAKNMRYGNGNAKRNDDKKVKKTNQKLDYQGDNEKTSKIRNFLDSKADQKETISPKDDLYTIHPI